jgi:hypothetical protein
MKFDGRKNRAAITGFQGIRWGARQCQRLFRQLDFRLDKPQPL